MCKQVVVIDDDPIIRDLIAEVLRLEGYTVWCGEDGEALGKALLEPPDLILLDLLMPEPYSGWETRRMLLRHPRTASVPVVIMTALRSADAWQADLRAAGRLFKPFNLVDLISVVAGLIGPGKKVADGD